MKLFRLIGTMTIVAAVAATMAVSASALTATYADNKVTLGGVDDATAGDYTVVITTAEENNQTSEGDIFQLAQSEDKPAEIAVDPELAPGKYYVRVGGYEAGYQNAEFVKALEVAATGAMQDAENAEDDAVAYYYVICAAPKGLRPYWTNGDVTMAADNNIDWANIDADVKLGLTVEEAKAVDANMALLWK